jgi:hypothetical protein
MTKRSSRITCIVIAYAMAGVLSTQGGWFSLTFILGLALGCSIAAMEEGE